jgi:hypothetical protein
MRSLRTTDFDRIASSAPLNTTASVVRDSPGEHWSPQPKDDRIHSDVPIPCARLPAGAADLTGLRTGRLVIIGYHSRRKKNGRMWVVRCQCGAYEVRKASKLTAERPPGAPELTCMDCEALRHAQQAQHAAVTGRWPSGQPATKPLGLNVQGSSTTLNDLGALRTGRLNLGARR